MTKENKHIGSTFDSFLEEIGELEEIEASVLRNKIEELPTAERQPMRICQLCFNGTTYRGIKQETYTLHGHTITIQQPGLWCDNCDDGILNGEDLNATRNELEMFQLKVRQQEALKKLYKEKHND